MANLYFSLPVAANVAGAAVDISATGVEKTIVVKGPFSGTLTLEISLNAGASWCALTTFFGPGKKVLPFAANRIRVFSQGANGLAPFTPAVDIGTDDTGGAFVVIPPPPANGAGVPVNITALGQFSTVAVQGSFGGGVIGIQISENGVDFAEAMTFAAPGCQSKVMVGDFARAVSRGAKPGVPFAPICAMGAINDDFAVSSLIIEDEGIVVGTRPILNFLGAGVTAVDDPPFNRVDVTIPGGAPLSNNPPTQIDIGDVAQVGVSTDAARADHQHAVPVPTVVSTLTPDNAPALGASTVVAREDHVHGIAADAPATVTAAANAEGIAASFSRSDHVHRLGMNIEEEGVLTGIGRPTINFIGASITAVDNPGADRVDVTVVAASTGDHSGWFWGSKNIGAAADTRFISPGREESAIAPVVDAAQIPIFRAGTLQNFYVRHNAAAGNGNSVVYAVMKNGVATAITATLATGAVGQASDLVNTVAVVAGDRVSLRATKDLGLGGGDIDLEASLEIAF